ncbi:sugar transferase [Aestuariivita boseongensis]|uniref:sugar transferase n=1 Tax=Aestuariivita boseongensis TaxID=1470562 RepID=UPI000680E9F5
MKDFARDDVLTSAVPKFGAPAQPALSLQDARVLPGGGADLRPSDRAGYRAWGKRGLDIALVLLSLPVTVPIILISALALWIEGGLPFYTQDRLGRNGRRFRIVKLRTMVRDADERLEDILASDPALRAEWDDSQKLKNDPRITRVGQLLRVTSMDELPQLWNVLKGEMTLVGPRPMMPQQLPLYGDPRAYFAMRPGLTGAWQVSARNENGFETRRSFDAQYHGSQSLGADLAIMWRTLGVVLRRTGY